MSCGCGLQHRLAISEIECSDVESLKKIILWAKPGHNIEQFNIVVAGVLDSEFVSYALYDSGNSDDSFIPYVQTDDKYKEKGFASEIVCHIIASFGKTKNLFGIGTWNGGRRLLKGCGFSPPTNEKKRPIERDFKAKNWHYLKGSSLSDKCCNMLIKKTI